MFKCLFGHKWDCYVVDDFSYAYITKNNMGVYYKWQYNFKGKVKNIKKYCKICNKEIKQNYCKNCNINFPFLNEMSDIVVKALIHGKIRNMFNWCLHINRKNKE